ncbi:hypothetical protein D3C73_1230300 [compost metagenome]
MFCRDNLLFQLGHGFIESPLPDQYLHLSERSNVGLSMLFQGGVSDFAFWQIEQWLKRFERLGDAFFGGFNGLLHLLIIFFDQQISGIPGVVPYTCGNDHDRLDLRPVLFDDNHRLFLERCQIVQRVKRHAHQCQRRN